MATIVRETVPTEVVHEHDHTGSDSGAGFLLGVVLLLIVAFAFLYYGLPLLRGGFSRPQVNVPSKVDVNVNHAQ